MGYGYPKIDRLRINDWLQDPNAPKTLTHRNTVYVRECRQIEKEFSRIIIVAYFMLSKLGMGGVRQIHKSAVNQKSFVIAVRLHLKEVGVEPKYYKVFKDDFDSIHARINHAFNMLIENLKLTEYYPYFAHVGFERLVDWSYDYPDDNEKANDQLLTEIEKYNAEHSEEIAKHMEETREVRENLERRRRQILEQKKEEKRKEKEKKRQEKEEIKEMKENARKHRAEELKIDRSLNHLYKDAERFWAGKEA